MVCINNFSISFGETKILEDVTFQVKEGEIVSLLGQSGCGKTTILRSIAGLQREHGGNICIGDSCVSSSEVFKKDREVGYIFQDYALFPHLNVEENIAFALESLNNKEKQKRVDELLEQFDIVNHRNKPIHQLSGGQQQRVAIARAMANKPKILLLDEPFANLDSILRYKTKMWLKKLIHENNLSAILVTHDKKEALSISDRIGVIHNKRLQQFSTTKDIYENPKNYYIAKFLSDINILPNKVATTFSHNVKDNELAIINIDKCALTTTQNDFKVNILDISFCGEYSEVLVELQNINEEHTLMIKTSSTLDENSTYYLDIKAEDIKIIEE